MNRRSKIIIISVFALAGLLVFIFSRGLFGIEPVEQTNLTANLSSSVANETLQNPAADENFNLDVQDQLNYKNETIPLLWADNNDNENLIIKSDRKYYDGHDSSEVYLGITNASGQDQDITSYFHFNDGTKGVRKLYVLEDDEWKALKIARSASLGEAGENLKLIENWKLKIENSGRKPVANQFPQAEFSYFIPKEQTAYFKAEIFYPVGAKGEFLVEAFGNNKAYGLLDPYYASGLVGNWTFNGQDMNATTAYDRSGSSPANNGDVRGGATKVPGISGQALSFDGVDDYVNCGAGTSIQVFGTNKWTISWWANVVGAGDAVQDFFNGLSHKPRIVTNISNRNLILNANVGGICTGLISSDNNVYSFNLWTHFTIEADTTLYRLFVNGVQVKTASYVQMDSPFSNFYIGKPSWADESFKGLIDEVRIYNRALSASEIEQLYRIGARKATF